MCLVKCGEVLGACVEVLRGAEEEVLLQEIAGSKEAQSKLHGQLQFGCMTASAAQVHMVYSSCSEAHWACLATS